MDSREVGARFKNESSSSRKSDVESVGFRCDGGCTRIKNRSSLMRALSFRLYTCCGMDIYEQLATPGLECEFCERSRKPQEGD